MSIKENLSSVLKTIPNSVTLVAVSKTKPLSDIQLVYDEGQRIFGENKVQEMTEKWEKLPKDIEWHMIGHLQRNKVKYMAQFVSLIHGVDSLRLLSEINKQAKKHNRTISCLLQVHIAEEETKFGFDEEELIALVNNNDFKEFKNVKLTGLMGMATFTDDMSQIRREFKNLKSLYSKIKNSYPDFST